MKRQPNTQYILSMSYGKDSLACLAAIEQLGLPLDRIVHAEVWATDTISADLPPMVEFKKKADAIIKERWGIEVEHICAMAKDGTKQTYEKIFYHVPNRRKSNIKYTGKPNGFPLHSGGFCNDHLKVNPLKQIGGQSLDSVRRESTDLHISEHLTAQDISKSNPRILGFPIVKGNWCVNWLKIPVFSKSSLAQGAKINTVQYLGIAADEPERIARHTKDGYMLPLVEIGWDEAYCRQWCEKNDLLSPTYTTATRGGCWFCHNQPIDQLRLLRKNYPEYWQLLLKWDSDSPVTFKTDGHTVHDYDKRFEMEGLGLVPTDKKFRWKMLKEDYY